DRLALDVDALDDRLVDGARQVAADLGDRILDVVQRPVGIDLEPELDRGRRLAVGDGRADMLDAGDRGDGVLDLLGDLRLQLGRRRTGVGDRDRDERHVDVREPRDRQPHEGDDAEGAEDDEKQDGRNRVADRPGGEVPAHPFAPSLSVSRLASPWASTAVTASPSRTKVPARSTTCSPGAMPSRISTMPL